MSLNSNWLRNSLRLQRRVPTGDQSEAPRPVVHTSPRKTFIASLIASGLFIYMYLGNFQLLVNSRYSAEVGIANLWISDEARYYLHMVGINVVMLAMIIFLWVWRRMSGKRLVILVLFFNLAALTAGYTTLHGTSFTVTNEKMKEAVEGLARTAHDFPTANLKRYPRSPYELLPREIPQSPYSYKGKERPLNIIVVNRASGPVKEFSERGDRAGAIYYAVDGEGKHFWITYLGFDFDMKKSIFAVEKESGKIIVLTEQQPPLKKTRLKNE